MGLFVMFPYAQLFKRVKENAKGASIRELTKMASREPSVEGVLAYELVISQRILGDTKTSVSSSSFWNSVPVIKKCCESASRKCDEFGCTTLICKDHSVNEDLEPEKRFCSYSCRDLYAD